IGLTFAQVLRSFLRQDPNVILVGEIRDRETAAIAIQAALTGHLVVSSVHTNDAPGAVGRLLDMGIEPFLVASAVSLILAQRLVRRNCPACRQATSLTPAEQEQLGLVQAPSSLQVWQGVGCPACFGTGYRGRVALAERMPVSPALADLISQRVSVQALRRQAIQEGMRPLRADGLAKLAQGITSPAEVLRETLGVDT
ncbi:MAG: Flp pilus assembly complex ATPase component TadA, partial [Candidatus Latescibacteria bacterium]|nr:Flp pilus assembly complex ATPase component TadA [Candidatus Latescibacterota bacterium]